MFPLAQNKLGTCLNKKLVRLKNYFVTKVHVREGGYYRFEAVLGVGDKKYLASSTAFTPGICNAVRTQDHSKSCGLATKLMSLCYIDGDITAGGGVDPRTDRFWEDDQEAQQKAQSNCQILIYLRNTATPPAAATGYFSAALKVNYPMMFTFGVNGKANILNVGQAKPIYGNDPLGFNNKFGQHWYFCKCRDLRRQECLAMQ